MIDEDGSQIGIVKTADALRQAKERNLDLVEIQPNARPPVCRIMDHGKQLYAMKKRQKGSGARRTQVKGMPFRYNTDSGDYNTKMRKVLDFLSRGDKVKITIRFRGREMQHRELGMELLEKIQKDLGDQCVVDNAPRLEGRQLSMLVSPSKALLAQVEKEKAQKEASSSEDS